MYYFSSYYTNSILCFKKSILMYFINIKFNYHLKFFFGKQVPHKAYIFIVIIIIGGKFLLKKIYYRVLKQNFNITIKIILNFHIIRSILNLKEYNWIQLFLIITSQIIININNYLFDIYRYNYAMKVYIHYVLDIYYLYKDYLVHNFH